MTMPEVYLCRATLPQGKVAVAYADKEDPDYYLVSKSIVRIQSQEAKEQPVTEKEFEISGEEIISMHYFAKRNALAIALEGSSQIHLYSLSLNRADIVTFPSHIQSWAATE